MGYRIQGAGCRVQDAGARQVSNPESIRRMVRKHDCALPAQYTKHSNARGHSFSMVKDAQVCLLHDQSMKVQLPRVSEVRLLLECPVGPEGSSVQGIQGNHFRRIQGTVTAQGASDVGSVLKPPLGSHSVLCEWVVVSAKPDDVPQAVGQALQGLTETSLRAVCKRPCGNGKR